MDAAAQLRDAPGHELENPAPAIMSQSGNNLDSGFESILQQHLNQPGSDGAKRSITKGSGAMNVYDNRT